MKLFKFGWKSEFEPYLKNTHLLPARVILQHRNKFRLITENGEIVARAAGNLFFRSEGKGELPAVGDWVLFESSKSKEISLIKKILPRFSKLSRKIAGSRMVEQVIAANIDTVFIISGLDGEYNPAKIERLLVVIRNGGAQPVLLLNKADLNTRANKLKTEIQSRIPTLEVFVLSAKTQPDFPELNKYLYEGATITLLGSSGVGKSTLLNKLAGKDLQKTMSSSEKGKGKHTTTHRQLFVLPGGALLIDTPGLKEIQLWDAEEGMEDAFEDIENMAENCYFSDCTHKQEPNCAVKKAVETGRLEKARLEHFIKVKNEKEQFEQRNQQTSRFSMRHKKFLKRRENLKGEDEEE